MADPTSHNRDNAPEILARRQAALAVLARGETGAIAHGLASIATDVEFTTLRQPETGLVMLRGRIGGDGAPFNAGEATVTRAAVKLATGETGFGYVLGRDREKARLIAICDALWQVDARRPLIEQHVLSPLRQQQHERLALVRAQTAATRVDFFTLVRGEDDR